MAQTQDQMKDMLLRYYSSLFKKDEPAELEADWNIVNPQQATYLWDLDRQFIEEEIKEGIFSVAKDKALGPDRFPTSFYQKYSEVIKQDICRFFEVIYRGSIDLLRINYAYICLIPKKQENRSVKDYRPIYLENGLMKIFTKVLSARLLKHFDSLVTKIQSAFIKGRQISDSYLSASEIISTCKRNKDMGLVYKLDWKSLW